MGEPDREDAWWLSFYHDALADMFLVRHDRAELDAAVAFLRGRLDLRASDTAFDQCCGIGSVSVELAKQGVRVVGVDASEPYVRRANEAAEAAGVDARFYAGDAFDFVAPEPCDAAFNWYSSFGYALDDARNLMMLRRAFESLRPGGRFALDGPNMAGLLRAFQPAMVRRRATPAGEVLLVRESEVDLPAGLLRQRWTFVLPDGRRRSADSRVRLYLPHALGEMLRAAGFEGVEYHGDVRGEPLGLDAPRCVALARRPGR